MSTARRYALYQLPGALLACFVLALLVRFEFLSAFVAVVLLCVWVIKDIALYPFLRSAYEFSLEHDLVGRTAIANSRLSPDGWVRVRGELWLARLEVVDVEAGRGEDRNEPCISEDAGSGEFGPEKGGPKDGNPDGGVAGERSPVEGSPVERDRREGGREEGLSVQLGDLVEIVGVDGLCVIVRVPVASNDTESDAR